MDPLVQIGKPMLTLHIVFVRRLPWQQHLRRALRPGLKSSSAFSSFHAGAIGRHREPFSPYDVDELVCDLFQPYWPSVLLPKRHRLSASDHSAGD